MLAILWVTLTLTALFTFVVYFAERHASGTEIHNLFDAFIYSVSQLVTASSVASPTTTGGKIIQIALEVYAIFVVATLAGSFGAFFHRRSQEHDRAQRAAARSAKTKERKARAAR